MASQILSNLISLFIVFAVFCPAPVTPAADDLGGPLCCSIVDNTCCPAAAAGIARPATAAVAYPPCCSKLDDSCCPAIKASDPRPARTSAFANSPCCNKVDKTCCPATVASIARPSTTKPTSKNVKFSKEPPAH